MWFSGLYSLACLFCFLFKQFGFVVLLFWICADVLIDCDLGFGGYLTCLGCYKLYFGKRGVLLFVG